MSSASAPSLALRGHFQGQEPVRRMEEGLVIEGKWESWVGI